MSLTSVDFPEPGHAGDRDQAAERERHVHPAQVVLARALDHHLPAPYPLPAGAGTGMASRPDRYAPVSDSGLASRSATVPETTMLPPCSPAPGPMSTTQSAARMVSSSCSTTISVLPRFRSRSSVSSSRWLSRWCSPIDGSSST